MKALLTDSEAKRGKIRDEGEEGCCVRGGRGEAKEGCCVGGRR